MSIAERLIEAGHDLTEIGEEDHESLRAVSVLAIPSPETPGGYIVGLSYTCDFRAEEEWGSDSLHSAFASRADASTTAHRILTADIAAGISRASDPRAYDVIGKPGRQGSLVTVLDDVVSLRTGEIFGPEDEKWSDASREKRAIEESRTHIRYARGYVTGRPSLSSLEHETFQTLRARARSLGIERPKTTKRGVIDQIIEASPPSLRYTEPANFHDGRHLVIPRTGAVGIVLDGLLEAVRANALVAGGRLSNPFSRGLVFVDERDFPAQELEKSEAQADWHRSQMIPVQEVGRHLRSTGTSVYYIGSPRQGENGEVRYSVNLSHRGIGQFWGEFTLAEMMSEGFAEREATAYRNR